VSDLAKWKLLGPVHSARIATAEWDLNREEWQPSRSFAVAVFHPDGKILESEHHNPDGSVLQSKFVYDQAGRLTETQFRNEDEPAGRILYSYDDAGRLLRTLQVDPEGNQRESEVCSYDSRGRKTKVCFLPPAISGQPWMTVIEGTELGYGAPGATTMTVNYGDTGLSEEALFPDAQQILVRRVTFERRADGKLLSEELCSGDQAPWPDLQKRLKDASPDGAARVAGVFGTLFGPARAISRTNYVYDRDGRLTGRTTRLGSISETHDTFLYDEHGNTVEQTTEQNSRELQMDEQGSLKTASERSSVQHSRMEYRYDGQGNWTERVIWSRLEPNPNLQRSNIERREITYYAV